MSMVFVIIVTYLACRIVPRLLVELVVTAIGMRLIIANRRARRTLLEVACPAGTADWDRKPSRVERRALKRGLNVALDMTVLTSLLPQVAVRAHRFAGR
jgi:hypothetical protein